ncbi:MAG TPA: prepilin-type N-terminal cleavage/methylation domain-containing protein [Candidatus Limnocylindrales bacterium]|nr:prepilin-type N-terminal cleavage/methylation domain-containing protein [Candidatus Limnocylindrales bacterium]
MSLRRNEEGFTLTELLAAFAILGFTITAIYTFYLSGLLSWNRSIERMEYQQTVRISLDTMIRELRYAREVEIAAENLIAFKIMGDTRIYRFRQSGETLLYAQHTAGNAHIASNVIALGITGLSFSIDQTSTVTITVTAGSGSQRTTISSSIRPRNIL